MEKAYAQALWDLIQKGDSPKAAVSKIHASLAARGRAAMMPAIAREFERLAQREALKNRSVLIVARKADEAKARKESGAADAELNIDESIIGGWKLFDKGVLTDNSWKAALLSIYHQSVK